MSNYYESVASVQQTAKPTSEPESANERPQSLQNRHSVRRVLNLPVMLKLADNKHIPAKIIDFSRSGLQIEVAHSVEIKKDHADIQIAISYFDHHYELWGMISRQVGETIGVKLVDQHVGVGYRLLTKIAKINNRNKRFYGSDIDSIDLSSFKLTPLEIDKLFYNLHAILQKDLNKAFESIENNGFKFITLKADTAKESQLQAELMNSIAVIYPKFRSMLTDDLTQEWLQLKEKLDSKGQNKSAQDTSIDFSTLTLMDDTQLKFSRSDVNHFLDKMLRNQVHTFSGPILAEINIRLSHALGYEMDQAQFDQNISLHFFLKRISKAYQAAGFHAKVDEVWAKVIELHLFPQIKHFYNQFNQQLILMGKLSEIKNSPLWKKQVESSVHSIFESAL